MKYITGERIKYFKKAYYYLKKNKKLSAMVIVFSFLASIFDGFSVGAIMPFFQALISSKTDTMAILPIFEGVQKKLLEISTENALVIIMVFALLMIIFKAI
jgi:hypothetical protein